MNQRFPQLALVSTMILGLLAAVLIGNAIGSSNVGILARIVAGAAGVSWLVLAGRYWWGAMAFGLGIGGFFTVPFKIYPHEFTLALALGALLPQLILSRNVARTDRPKLPRVYYVLGFYLIGHFAFSMVQNSGAGAGNVSRAYMNALWPLVFGYYFWRFGSTSILRRGLLIMYLAALIRMGFGLLNYYDATTHVVPGINYSIDPQDLRASGNIVLIIALLFATMRGNAMIRLLNAAVALFSVWVILLGGSRLGAAMLLVIPVFAFAVGRKWLAVAGTLICSGIFILFLNEYPKVLESLPVRATRAVSVFLLEERLDVQEQARDSNRWHREALPQEAFRRWSASAKTVAFGTGVKPYRPISGQMWYGRDTLYRWAKVSADMGAYESAFWTVLAVLGASGLLLYASFLLWILWHLMPALMRRKQRDAVWAIQFWACLWIAQWFLFAIPTGSYPSWEIFLGIIALAATYDARPRHEEVAPAPTPARLPLHNRSRVPATAGHSGARFR